MRKNLLFLASIVLAATVLLPSCDDDDDDVKVEGIAINKTTTVIEVGSTETLSVIFTPLNASNKRVTWSSDDNNIATVSADGVVTAVAEGDATITATSNENIEIKATCEVEVSPASGSSKTVSGHITANTKWYANTTYMLDGFVYVDEGATLTIEPGTVIKGVINSKGTLIIQRGAKIMAQGTADAPIVFTSAKAKGERSYGDWGGLVLCGYAPTNKHDVSTGVGTAEGGIDSQYGGTDPHDNSGVLQYVRIEFPGIALTSTSNSEINGLTLYAIGDATTIDHIQVSYSGDDSYEWFGGTVNVKYIVAFRGWDDEFDTDNGYVGKVQFAFGLRDPNSSDQSGSNGFESDNDADGSTLTPTTKPIFSNVSLYGPLTVSSTLPPENLFKRSMHLRRGTRLCVYNSIFAGYPKGLNIDGEKGNTPTQAENNVLQIENCVLAGMATNYEVSSAATQADPYTVEQVQAYFESANRNNSKDITIAQIIGTNLINLSNPSLLPISGSPVLSGASFTNPNLSDSFFTSTAFKGAFGTENWTEGWCNWDPQNTDY
ncbi:MAG: Ig-like domain-containing protein [Bacteroidales bacterium]